MYWSFDFGGGVNIIFDHIVGIIDDHIHDCERVLKWYYVNLFVAMSCHMYRWGEIYKCWIVLANMPSELSCYY